eukprot:UN28881
MIIGTRRNKGIGIHRKAYMKRDTKYTQVGVLYRGCLNDQSSMTNVVHYVGDGTATIEFLLRKGQYLVPAVLLLRCLKDCTDREIYEQMMMGQKDNSFLSERIELMLRLAKNSQIRTQTEALAFWVHVFVKCYIYLN